MTLKTDALRSDAELVAGCLDGQREAFREIVERYQTLICSLAYNVTGSVSRSEDLAQETFVTAWSRLDSLREPEKLRAWLCGIARFRIQRERRAGQHEPLRDALPLEDALDTPAIGALPSDQAVTRDEEAILWRALERMPELYREPLILYYREHQSLEHVAAALELSEDAVKQRLSRGRRLLQEEVQAFVENTLRRTAPGRAFSGTVLTMLPLLPFLGIGAGVAAQWLMVRDLTADRRRRRRWIVGIAAAWIAYVALAAGGEATVHWMVRASAPPVRFVAIVSYWWCFVAGTLALQVFFLRRFKLERIASLPAVRMAPGAVAAVVIGLHFALFGWLVTLAWRRNDPLGTAVILGALLVLCVVSCVRLRHRAGHLATIIGDLGEHMALAGGVILLVLGLRADVWIASAHGLTVSEAHRALPIWLVPALALALVGWTVLLFGWTRPGRTEASRARVGI